MTTITSKPTDRRERTGMGNNQTGESTVLEERQGQLHKAIVNEIIALTPEWWNAAILTVSVESKEGAVSMPHEFRSPEGHSEPIMPSDDLFTMTRQLLLLFEEFGQPWTKLRYSVSSIPDGNWRWQCEFTYGDSKRSVEF